MREGTFLKHLQSDDKCKICVPFPPSKCSTLILFFFPTVSFHSIQTTTRTGLHCCEKSKCKSICHIVQLLLQEIKKTETSYLKLTNNALFEVMAMKRAVFVGYGFMLPKKYFLDIYLIQWLSRNTIWMFTNLWRQNLASGIFSRANVVIETGSWQI